MRRRNIGCDEPKASVPNSLRLRRFCNNVARLVAAVRFGCGIEAG